MKKNEAIQTLQLLLYNRFGTFLTLGDVGVLRRAEGRSWGGKVHLELDTEKITVGVVEIDADGNLISIISKQDIVDKIRQIVEDEMEDSSDGGDDFSDLFMDMADDESETFDPEETRRRIDELLSKGDEDSLLEARGLYPLLLQDPVTRGAILHEMGLLEIALTNRDLALEYLEAATREYANLAQVELIFKIADRVEKLIGVEEFEKTSIYTIMKKTVERMYPLKNLADVPMFAGLPEGAITELQIVAQEVNLNTGETIIREGDSAQWVVIIKSGLLDVVLEGFDVPRTVRSCFPGEFLGESSVLSPPGTLACTASLVSPTEKTKVWKFHGSKILELMEKFPELAFRIKNAKVMHQLDSFFSMHESMQELEVSVRDEILGCMTTIMMVSPGDVLIEDEEIPENVYLIMNGKVQFTLPSGDFVQTGPDHFVGMRDALHGIAIDGEYVAIENTTVVIFDSDKLRQLAVNSPPNVVAILERLN
ncbi:MAG: cyclic nucleotide-binding domain-containing protein [Deltaproteobacteria bacterium]|nr:cyclic nucleotide-binding domain-containing protein [Deltaproteobacteria bacterium]